MRILRLDLKAFGPFTDHKLTLDQGQFGLHLVYGPNEAGKSSALRALRHWLFGIPNVTGDNFLHANPNLRIGGLIEDEAGQQLEFIRRKGRSKTVRGADDQTSIDDAVLGGFLQGIDEAAFRRRFGIDYEELREGGRGIFAEGGELGELLFSAGAGVADFGRIRKQLETEAGEIFNPRARSKKIYNHLSDLKKARQSVKENRVPTQQWIDLTEEVERATTRRKRLDDALTRLRTDARRLERIQNALPLAGARGEVMQQLDELRNTPQLPDDFVSRRVEVVTQLAHEREVEKTAAAEVALKSGELETISLPGELLKHRTAVTHLKDQLGQHQKAQEDRPLLIRDQQTLETTIFQRLNDLGKPADISIASELRVSRSARQKIESLAGRYHAIRADRRQLDATAAKLQRQLREQSERLAAMPEAADVTAMRAVIRECQELGPLDAQLEKLRHELADQQESAGIQLTRLPLWDGSVEDVESLVVPNRETMERFRDLLHQTAQDVQTAAASLKHQKEELESANTQYEALQAGQPIPSEEQLAEIRNRRDAGLQMLMEVDAVESASVRDDVKELIDEFAPGETLWLAVRNCISQADEISDRLRREADRVFRQADLQARISSLQRRLTALEEELQQRQREHVEADGSWCELWTQSGISPLPPEEMLSWNQSLQEIRQLATSIRQRQREADGLTRQIASARDRLIAALGDSESSGYADVPGLRPILSHCVETLDAAEEINRERELCASECRRLKAEMQTTHAESQLAAASCEEWQQQWEDAIGDLKVDRSEDPEVATIVLQQLEELNGDLREHERLTRRINDIDSEFAAFESGARDVLSDVAPELLAQPVLRAVHDLHDRLVTAEKDSVRCDGLQKQIGAASLRHQQAVARLESLTEQQNELCALAGVTSIQELPELETRAALRQKLLHELEEINGQMTVLAAGEPLEAFIDSLAKYHIDTVRAERDRLNDEIQTQETERQTLDESVGGRQQELRAIDGQSRAAQAQEQVELLSSELRDFSEQYVRLHLASTVLHAAIERYREDSQGPVLEHASRLFAELTLNSFSGLRAEFNDKGEAVIAGVRAGSGDLVLVEGMSEGTRDQLYLSLRLSLLETTLSTGRRMPLILDDVLIMFDDARTAATLKILAELSERTQVMYFTHHEHLLELAQQHVSEDTLFIHRINTGADNHKRKITRV